MIDRECGPAAVLVFRDGMKTAELYHEHDGGEAYMGPVLRRAVAYARTHYDSGDIEQVLLSEPEMEKILPGGRKETILKARHVYYVVYSFDEEASKKTYSAFALHGMGTHLLPADFCEFARDIPCIVKKII